MEIRILENGVCRTSAAEIPQNTDIQIDFVYPPMVAGIDVSGRNLNLLITRMYNGNTESDYVESIEGSYILPRQPSGTVVTISPEFVAQGLAAIKCTPITMQIGTYKAGATGALPDGNDVRNDLVNKAFTDFLADETGIAFYNARGVEVAAGSLPYATVALANTALQRAEEAYALASQAGSGLPEAIQIVEFTGAATDIDVFINAYNALPATGGTLVLVGNGNIQITDSKYIPILAKPTTIIGYGAKMSIKNNGNSETSAITTSSDLIMLGGTYTISAGSQPITLISGGYIMSTGGIMMQDCVINNSGTKGTAIYLEQASYYKIINCKITYTGTGSLGIYLTTPGSSDGIIRDCYIGSATSITSYDLSDLQIINNKIRGNASFGGGLSVDNLSIIGNKWESGTCSLTAMEAASVFADGNYGTADFTSWTSTAGVTIGQNYVMEVV